jgi:cysteine desulfurase / selenocysteine lyase
MNIEAVRADTSGCEGKIYLDSAGSSLMPGPVVQKMKQYIEEEALSGGYTLARLKAAEVYEFYVETAKLLNCQPANIAFMYNATDAYSKALSSIPFKPGDCILTSNDDYASNQIAFISLQKRFGITIIRCQNLANGDIDFDNFEQLVATHRPVLTAITHIPTNSGMIQDAEKVGEICRRHNTWYLLDACQSVGQMVVDVQKIGCDFLSATGRKFLRGPRGTGLLYVSDKVLAANLSPLFIDMRGATWSQPGDFDMQQTAKRFETWEFPYASVIGLAAAIKYANTVGLENIQEYNAMLVSRLRNNLANNNTIQLLDKGSRRSAILTFAAKALTQDTLEELLKKHNIIYSVSTKSAALIDFTNKAVDWAIRLSPHYFNTAAEMDAVSEILQSM